MLEISEGDGADVIQQIIETKYKLTGDENKSVASCLEWLYGVDCQEISAADPEIRKSRLHDAMRMLLTREAQRTPAVFFVEDVHWADPSSLEFIQTCGDFICPALFIFTFRPALHLAPGWQRGLKGLPCREINLTNLSAEESRQLLESLLKPSAVPSALERFILEKVEGNPLYLEEMLNNLLESDALVEKRGSWQITKPLDNVWIPRTVQGHVAARIDCLNPRAKRVLQVAAVAGKQFSRTMLARFTDDPARLTDHLDLLEQHDLIRRTMDHPDPRYRFRHDIIREVVYKSLLTKERRELHDRLGMAMEELLPGSPDDTPEILAFHFKHGTSLHKAIRYLVQSARKSLQQYAVTEAHRFYGEAYDLLTEPGSVPAKDPGELIGLLNNWAPVFYFRGTFRELETLFRKHLPEADRLDDLEKRGMYYVWLGASLWGNEQFRHAYHFLRKALELGEQSNNRLVNGYAHTWLAWTCVDLGRMEEGIAHGKEARTLSAGTAWEHYPYFQSYDSDGYAYWALGACARVRESGERLLELGQKNPSIRGITWGNTVAAWGFMSAGDFASAIDRTKSALAASKDPLYTQFPRLSLGMCYVLCGEYQEAKELLEDVLDFANTIGCRYLGTPSRCFLSVVLTAEGRLKEGMRMLTDARRWWAENQALWRYTFSELIIGDIYAALARRTAPLSWTSIVKNGLFLAKNLPCAARNAAHHYRRAIELAHRIGAGVVEGQAHLSLGRLHKARKEHGKAVACFTAARSRFKACEAGALLELAEQEIHLMEEGKE
jgi:tetratricopeptide (TPR) repeat protein